MAFFMSSQSLCLSFIIHYQKNGVLRKMEISKQGNYTSPANQVSAMDSTLRDKLKKRLKYVVLDFLTDNPEYDITTGKDTMMHSGYTSDMYLEESIKSLNSLTELFNMINEHYSILNESGE
jgi:hypothetical protein